MKNYKYLVPMVLAALLLLASYRLYDSKAAVLKEYQGILASAREFREQDIQVDAEQQYLRALEKMPSVELAVELGDFYWETHQENDAVSWGEEVVKSYPNDAAGYEFLIKCYEEQTDYAACFDLADTMQKRGVTSQCVADAISRMQYYFYFNGEFEDVCVFSGGLAPVMLKNCWGYINQKGAKVIQAQFLTAGPFIEDLAPVVDTTGRAYFIDPRGNKKHVVLNVDGVQELGLVERGLFPLYNGKSWGFYNTEHQHLFGEYTAVSAIGNGIAAVQSNGKWSLVDRQGVDQTGKAYDSVLMDEKKVVFRNERLFVSSGEGYQMISVSGKAATDTVYEDARIFNDTTYAAVKMDGKWGFVDKDGNVMVTPKYQDARSFANGLAAVKLNNQWGFINLDGEMVIAPAFDDAKDFNSSGCVFVQMGGVWKLLRLYRSNY